VLGRILFFSSAAKNSPLFCSAVLGMSISVSLGFLRTAVRRAEYAVMMNF
jgi:hypothetical protein